MFTAKKEAGSEMESKDASEKKEFKPFERSKGRKSKKHGKRMSKR